MLAPHNTEKMAQEAREGQEKWQNAERAEYEGRPLVGVTAAELAQHRADDLAGRAAAQQGHEELEEGYDAINAKNKELSEEAEEKRAEAKEIEQENAEAQAEYQQELKEDAAEAE